MVFNSDTIEKHLLDLKKELVPITIIDICNAYMKQVLKNNPKASKSRKNAELMISEYIELSDHNNLINYPNEKFISCFIDMREVLALSLCQLCNKESYDTYSKETDKTLNVICSLMNVYNLVCKSYHYWIDEKKVFVEFSALTKDLEKLDIPAIDYAAITLELLKRNIDTGILEEDSKDSKDRIVLSVIATNNGLNDKILDDISSGKYEYLYTDENRNLTDLEKRVKQFIAEMIYSDENDSYADEFLNNYRVLKDHYFDKMDDDGNLVDFYVDDVIMVTSALDELGISPKIRNITKRILMKEVSKKPAFKGSNNDIINEDSIARVFKTNKVVRLGIPQQEYRKLRKKVEKLYNIHSGKPVRDLSIDEVYYCAGLMLEMGEEIGTIEVLFDRGLKKEKDPVKRFESEHDKWVYYGEKFGREDQISEMDEIYQEIISSSEEDKKEWSKMLGDCLKEFEFKIPFKRRYEYEIKKAKEFVKKRD